MKVFECCGEISGITVRINASGDVVAKDGFDSEYFLETYEEQCQKLWSDNYGCQCMFVETEQGVRVALMYEYDKCFANDCSLSFNELYSMALKDFSTLICYQELSEAEVFLCKDIKELGIHALIVTLPISIEQHLLDDVVLLLNKVVYSSAKELLNENN